MKIVELASKLAALKERGSMVIGPAGVQYAANTTEFARLLYDFSAHEQHQPSYETIRTTLSRACNAATDAGAVEGELPETHWHRIERIFGLTYVPGGTDWRLCSATDFNAALGALPLPVTPRSAPFAGPAVRLESRRADHKTALGRELLGIDLGPPKQLNTMEVWFNLEVLPVVSADQRYRLGFSRLRVELQLNAADQAYFLSAIDTYVGGSGWTVRYNRQQTDPAWVVEAGTGTDILGWLDGVIGIDGPVGAIVGARAGTELRATASIPVLATDVVYIGAPAEKPDPPHMEFVAQVMKRALEEGAGGYSKLVLAEQTLDVCAIDEQECQAQ